MYISDSCWNRPIDCADESFAEETSTIFNEHGYTKSNCLIM